jgi:hypothetical protein
MNTTPDDKSAKHISDDRLTELSRSTADAFSREEKTHLLNCDRCARLLAALFRLHAGHY